MTYKCNNCGKTFKASGSRVYYSVYTLKTLRNSFNIWRYLFSPCWYLCDTCTKNSDIDQFFKEDNS